MTEIEEKSERIVRLLNESDLDGVMLNAQHNFAWITGGGSNGVDLSRENGAASILITKDGKRLLLANNIEMPRLLAEEVETAAFEQIEVGWQTEKSVPEAVLETIRRCMNGKAGIATDLPLFSNAPAIENKIAPLRYELTAGEVERYRDLGQDTAEAIRRVVGNITPGQTEIEIAGEMRKQLTASNINSVVTLVAADDRIAKYRHPVPTANVWKTTLLLVTCAKRYGLITSLSRMVSVGSPSTELIQNTQAAALVNASLWHATRQGVTGADLYGAAADAYREVGFSDEINRHHQGGATGYRTREWVAHPENVEVVRSNQAFAWNPSITGTKVEDTIIVGAKGIEAITASPEFPTITTDIEGREYHSTGILSI